LLLGPRSRVHVFGHFVPGRLVPRFWILVLGRVVLGRVVLGRFVLGSLFLLLSFLDSLRSRRRLRGLRLYCYIAFDYITFIHKLQARSFGSILDIREKRV
jgi:hypothetical protein